LKSAAEERDEFMCNIDELTVMIRLHAQLPVGLKMKTDEFREGWSFAKIVDSCLLEKKIRARGWQFIKIADGFLRSGVGDSPQRAIASALNLGLRCVSEYFNAVGIESIQLTKYPWFWLARVTISPYRIQELAVLPVADEALLRPIQCRNLHLPSRAVDIFPLFGPAMRLLKRSPVTPKSLASRTV
jgi:hypothetical protein